MVCCLESQVERARWCVGRVCCHGGTNRGSCLTGNKVFPRFARGSLAGSQARRHGTRPGTMDSFDDPLCDRTSAQCAQCFHGKKPSQCTFGFHSMDTVHCVYLLYFYLPLRVSTLHICFLLIFSVLLLNLAVSRVTTLTSTVPPGLMVAESLL